MELRDALPAQGTLARGNAVTIGVFDGVHLGHQRLLGRTIERAQQAGGSSIVLTFREHPDFVMHGKQPVPLQSLEERQRALRAIGIDWVFCVPFTQALQRMGAADFGQKVLDEALGCRHLVLGFDSAICRGREGTVERFQEIGEARGRELGDAHGFTAERVEPEVVDGEVVSSSSIRAAIQEGRLSEAARFLGRPLAFHGRVEHGAKRGRELGFPTANLACPEICLPPRGVYAMQLCVAGLRHDAVANFGQRPSFEQEGLPLIEVHLLDFSGDLYGEEVEVSFLEYLRPERSFSSVETLKGQISEDCAAARRYFASRRDGSTPER